MKLLTYKYKLFGPRAAVKVGDNIVDLTVLLRADEVIRDVKMLLEKFPDPVSLISEALATAPVEQIPLDAVELCTPILQPPTVLDASIFEAHSKGAGHEDGMGTPAIWYQRPVFYYQNPNIIAGPEAAIRRKRDSVTLDYEAEVAFVVGKRGENVPVEKAEEYIFGLTIFNDWSDRATCGEEVGFLGMHKSKDFASGLGPWVVTMDEFADVYRDGRINLKVNARVNGSTTTDSTTGDMYWNIRQLFEMVAKETVIMPGEVVGLGTVGQGSLYEQGGKYPFLKDGDCVEIEVERIGTLRQYVAKA